MTCGTISVRHKLISTTRTSKSLSNCAFFKPHSPSNCAFWFKKFAEAHRYHRDPVCFQRAIFAIVCAYWCTQYNLQINPQVGAHFSQDCAIFLRLQYRPSRKMRLLELMCLTNFLIRPHNLFDMDNIKQESTRRGPA